MFQLQSHLVDILIPLQFSGTLGQVIFLTDMIRAGKGASLVYACQTSLQLLFDGRLCCKLYLNRGQQAQLREGFFCPTRNV